MAGAFSIEFIAPSFVNYYACLMVLMIMLLPLLLYLMVIVLGFLGFGLGLAPG